MTQKKWPQEIVLQGFPICPGVAIGESFVFMVVEEKVPERAVPDEEIEKEVARYYSALRASRKDVISLQQRLQRDGGKEAVAILGSHLEMMQDPLMTKRIEKEIRAKGKNSEYVFKSVITEYEEKFCRITDQFFRERLKDFQDISRRIIGHLGKKKRSSLSQLAHRAIVFAHELSPSDTAEAKSDKIDAFVTRSGAETSHVAIMARAKGIPFVSNVDFPHFSSSVPVPVVVDGGNGKVILFPTQHTLASYRKQQKLTQAKVKERVDGLKSSQSLLSETIDGHKVRLSEIIEYYDFSEKSPSAEIVRHKVGLFRSEYLFLSRDGFPTEEEQFACYKKIAEEATSCPAVIRTFDIGGDKLGNLHPTRYEQNPYLGCRAIRLMLKERSVFKKQIRAIARSSAFGEVSILFPMISGLAELLEAKAVVEEVKKDLSHEGIPFSRHIPIGCMIEVPSAAMICDILLEACDFLSIGTNDLVQYSLACDRGNPAMSYLYTPTHPAIVRMIKRTVEESNRLEKPVSICGEIAADPKFAPLLLGLGVHELCVAPTALSSVKEMIRRISIVEATALADKVLTLKTAEEIQEVLTDTYNKVQEAYPFGQLYYS